MHQIVIRLQGFVTSFQRVLYGGLQGQHGWRNSAVITAAAALMIIMLALGWWWSSEPEPFDVMTNAIEMADGDSNQLVPGFVTTATIIRTTETLLNKSGGYLSNDITPPSVLMDNIANWEFGVLVQVRDLARLLRSDISRSQSQSIEDKDLIEAEPQLHFSNDSWWFPATEGQYEEALDSLQSYLQRLSDDDKQDAQFYVRADNFSVWLEQIEKRLGSLSQRLSASVGQTRINTDLSGDPYARQSTPTPALIELRTPWSQIDDVFYEARGATWALSQFLKAAEIDFYPVLKKKNAVISLRQIIRELDATQETVWSPMILNGSGFGFFANHSLVMANYISRANATVIELRQLLAQG